MYYDISLTEDYDKPNSKIKFSKCLEFNARQIKQCEMTST